MTMTMITETEIENLFAAEFESFKEPLSEISMDTVENKSMLDCSTRFYNYDKIAEKIYSGNNKPKTPDMIFFNNGIIFFVEFKNGQIEGKEKECKVRTDKDECKKVKWEIKLKSIEGGFLVFHRAISKYRRNGADFWDIAKLKKYYILVYNAEKNPVDINIKGRVRFHNAFNTIKVRFGLGIYRKSFFEEVGTFTKDVFEHWLMENRLLDESDK